MKLGLALSGGGIRGIAHAGVLKALEENNIKIDAIGGTSSGSIIATLYAMGYSPYYIYILFKRYAKDLVNRNSISKVTNIGSFMANKKLNFQGFYSGEEIEKCFNNIASRKGIKKISDIKMPIVIPTVDVQNSRKYIITNNIPEKTCPNTEYINSIEIGKAIRASSSFPVVFCPCEYNEHKFLDGGILDNFPTIEVRHQGVEKVLTINFKADDIEENSNIMDIVMRISEENISNSDMVLTIQTDKTGLLETEKMDACYKYGYRQTINQIDKIKNMINDN